MLGLLIASQLVGARPIPNEMWFANIDPPSSVRESDDVVQTVTQTLVDKNGKVVGCRVEEKSKQPKADAFACAAIIKLGKFRPGHWSDGTPVPSIFRYTFTFNADEDAKPTGDLELSVDRLPDGARSSVLLTLDYAADADGKISDCADAPQPGLANTKADDPGLVTLACTQLVKNWQPFTVLDEAGKPTRSVQNAYVVINKSR